jgi:hypothetical protein
LFVLTISRLELLLCNWFACSEFTVPTALIWLVSLTLVVDVVSSDVLLVFWLSSALFLLANGSGSMSLWICLASWSLFAGFLLSSVVFLSSLTVYVSVKLSSLFPGVSLLSASLLKFRKSLNALVSASVLASLSILCKSLLSPFVCFCISNLLVSLVRILSSISLIFCLSAIMLLCTVSKLVVILLSDVIVPSVKCLSELPSLSI